jgi:Domain of unknown function (DUF4397)
MKLRRLGLTVAASALALTAFAGTASAAAPGATVNVAHGIPGVKVDVCVAGSAVKTDFKYGQQFRATLPAGTYTIRVKAADHFPTCKGTQLIKQTVTLTDGLNATAVANYVAGKPALSIFVNDVAVPSADEATITVRHTAKAPTVDVWLNGGTAPAVENLARHKEAGPVAVPEGVYSWWVSADGGYAPVIGPRVAELKGGRAYQILAVGTNAANYRFIVISQAGMLPS